MSQDVAAAGERIESLLAASAAGGAAARERAEELVRVVADLYGAGLERLQLGDTDNLDFKPRPRWPLDPDAPPAIGAGVKA